MMPFLISLAARLGVDQRFQRIAEWIIGIFAFLALCGLLWGGVALWFAHHDAGVVASDRAGSAAQVLNRQLEAERGAGAAKDQRDASIADNQSDLKEKADAAAANDTSPLDALFNELR